MSQQWDVLAQRAPAIADGWVQEGKGIPALESLWRWGEWAPPKGQLFGGKRAGYRGDGHFGSLSALA